MNEDYAALSNFEGVARLFPLGNLVFFPHAVQGLHIFEPRYRQMTADALEGDQLIALVLLPDTPDQAYLSVPRIESIACLGRITQAEIFPDGRYNLRLKGLARIRITEELPSEKPYREARCELLSDVVPEDLKKLSSLRKELANVVLPRFEPAAPALSYLRELFASERPLGHVCDMLSFALPLDVDLKQTLLEDTYVQRRAERLIDALRQGLAADAEEDDTPTQRRPFPPEFSPN